MAIQDNTFSLIAVRVMPGCSEAYRKGLHEQQFYFFNDRYVSEGDHIQPNPARCQMPDDFFGRNINVQAVCGTNGAGKSTLFEIVYRIINNLCCRLECDSYRGGGATRLWYIQGLYAELHYELNNSLFTIACCGETMYFEKEGEPRIDLNNGNHPNAENYNTIYRNLFYTLVTNYSMQSLVPIDYDLEPVCDWRNATSDRNWLDSIYNKNDGYRVAIGIEPYKWGNKYDMERQEDFANTRTALLLLNNPEFISGYHLDRIELEFDELVYGSKVEGFGFRNHVSGANYQALPPNDCLAIMFEKFEIDQNLAVHEKHEVLVSALAYIFDKILAVAHNYPTFEEFAHIQKELPNNYILAEEAQRNKFASLCEKIYTEPSHISTKIIQTINFIKAFLSHDISFNDCDLMNVFNYETYHRLYHEGNNFESLEEQERHFIPPYYKMTIWLRNLATDACVEYSHLSSGERQFIQQMGSCMYHMRNLMSVQEYQNENNFDRPKYHYFNLVLDEIEIGFHPEYQRTFLCKLIETIENLGINQHNHVNIILSSHSPFLLSDLPQGRVLLLENGEMVRNDRFSNTFGANISTLLNEDFFLSNGFIGGYAQKKITEAIYILKCERSADEDASCQDSIRQLISLVGDPLLHGALVSLFNEHYYSTRDERIQALEAEIQRLREQV